MKNMKKLVSLLLAVCLMASLAIGASAAEPTTVDVSGGSAIELIKAMIEEYMALFATDKFNICADETFDLGK